MKKCEVAQRCDLPEKMTWDLQAIYENNQAWEEDFSKLDGKLATAAAFQGKLAGGAEVLKAAFEAVDDLERLAEKLYVYSHLRTDEDTGNSENRARQDRIEAKFAEISGMMAWFEPEITAFSDELMDSYMKSPELELYHRSLNELWRARKHVLSAVEERMLGILSDALRSPAKIYSTLNNADLTFPKVKGEDGRKIELTHANYSKFLESEKRSVRRGAYQAMYNTYSGIRNTCAATLDGAVKTHVINAKLRGYPGALAAALFSDNVPEEVYRNLIDSVHKNIKPLHKYVKLRGRALGINKMKMYDLAVPIVGDCRREYSWEETVKTVKQALAPLGGEYGETLNRAFTERWVDILPCRGKRTGAYSSGCFDTYPYLLLNFTGTLNCVFTLAHELGHSMHSFYSNASQPYHYADYSIFVAEVASTTNEILLQHYLMKQCNDKALKAYLVSHLLDEVRTTVYRQTQFAEFELKLHELAEQGVPLTADVIDSEYARINKFYYGKHMDTDDLIAVEWARVPHFYYNFYVYKYATGMAAAITLAENILSGKQDKLDAYFGFLKAGSSKDVLDIMKDAGVDLSTPAPVGACLKMFDRMVDELAQLL